MSNILASRPPVFSLVLATLGTGHRLVRFMDSLVQQTGSFQLILVDQNSGAELDEIVARYRSDIEIVHIRCRPGLSLARNAGIRYIRGRIIAFPDDDCWYPRGLLAAVECRLADPRIDGLTCRCTDADGRLAAGGDDRSSGILTKANVWRRGVSATMFLKRELVDEIGGFDTTLGLGSTTVFQSGEETDYLLRAIAREATILYDPSLRVHHPCPPPSGAAGALYKSWSYALGMGNVLRKHDYRPASVLKHLAIPFIGALCALLRGDLALAKLRLVRTLGRWRGWRWLPGQDVDILVAPSFVRRPDIKQRSLSGAL